MRNRILILVLFLVGGFLWLFYTNQFVVKKTQTINNPAPQFEVKTLAGKPFALKDVIGKKVILVNFWATWCEPCQEETPMLNSLYKSLDPNDFELVSLMEDDAVDDADRQRAFDKFTKKIPIDFTVYADTNQVIADTYGTYKIPESYLIDKKGMVVERVEGMVTESSKAALIEKIRKLAK